MPNALAIWLKETKTPQADLAQRVGCTQSHISKLARGLKTPDLLARSIEVETGGRVPVASWAEIVATPPSSRKAAKRGGAVRRSARGSSRRFPQPTR